MPSGLTALQAEQLLEEPAGPAPSEHRGAQLQPAEEGLLQAAPLDAGCAVLDGSVAVSEDVSTDGLAAPGAGACSGDAVAAAATRCTDELVMGCSAAKGE